MNAVPVDVGIGVAEPYQLDLSLVAAVLPYRTALVSLILAGLNISSDD